MTKKPVRTNPPPHATGPKRKNPLASGKLLVFETQRYVTVTQLAKDWGRTRQTVRRNLDAAGAPFKCRKNLRYYLRSDIEALIAGTFGKER
jgi:predicted transcriptional regulator